MVDFFFTNIQINATYSMRKQDSLRARCNRSRVYLPLSLVETTETAINICLEKKLNTMLKYK